ncbi:MAG: ATP-dependent helicase HrpB [Bdellovibrionales bacterium]
MNFTDSVRDAFGKHDMVFVTAAPGVGKTTKIPPSLSRHFDGKVLVLEPRRMAAVAAAHRVAEVEGWSLGQQVGYQVRFESKVGPTTRLIYMTDALLLRQLSRNPNLAGVDVVVLDEFHERGLNMDLVFGFLREQQQLGASFKILLMSATLDLVKMRRLFPEAGVIDIPGEAFPLEIRHQSKPLMLRCDRFFIDRVVAATQEVVQETDGDVLVFLPGVGEIVRTEEALVAKIPSHKVVRLHGQMALAEQQEVLRPSSGQRRVVLATNVAEASVTVDGVRAVIDSGIAKVMECHLKTGFSQLDVQRISLFSARQRSGRAARQGPGLCVRLWTSHEEQTQDLESVPECQRVDLTQSLLWLAHQGISGFNSFSWLDTPPAALMGFAIRYLRSIQAIDDQNRITEMGRRLAEVPLPPRWGALLILGDQQGLGGLAAKAAALLNERDWNSKIEHYGMDECDLWARLENWGRGTGGSTLRQAARQLAEYVGPDKVDPTLHRLQDLLLRTQPDRLCRRRGNTERALMVGGRGVKLANESGVKKSEFFIALQGVDLEGQAETQISMASGLGKDDVLSVFGDQVQIREDIHFDEDKQKFFRRRTRYLFDLPIDSPSLTPVSAAEVADAIVDVAMSRWEWIVGQSPPLRQLMQRLRFYESMTQESLWNEERQRRVIEMACIGATRLEEVASRDWLGLMQNEFDRAWWKEFEKQVPARFLAPSGHSHDIDYSEAPMVFVEVRLQEIFGLAESPKLAGGTPLTFRLLAPNFRPTQVTSDLASFWRTGYPEVRKELRARYPKHSWPEDPMTAKPEAKGRRRS